MSEQYRFRVKFADDTSEEFDSLEVLPDGLLKVSKAHTASSSLFRTRTTSKPVVRCYAPHFWTDGSTRSNSRLTANPRPPREPANRHANS